MSNVREPSDEDAAEDTASPTFPDYELEPTVRADTPTRLRAMGNPVRNAILHLIAERASTATELAEAVGKRHGTVAHHLRVLEDAGLVRVVRTRQVRAVTERYWGRTGRTILVDERGSDGDYQETLFVREAMETFTIGDHGCTTLRYARIPADLVDAFSTRIDVLVQEFMQLPRSGDVTYGLLVALQPTDQPSLSDRPADRPTVSTPSTDSTPSTASTDHADG